MANLPPVEQKASPPKGIGRMANPAAVEAPAPAKTTAPTTTAKNETATAAFNRVRPLRVEPKSDGAVRVPCNIEQKPPGKTFYFGSAWQNKLLACLLGHRDEFAAIIPRIECSYFWSVDGLRVFSAITDYHEKYDAYPDLAMADAQLEETYGRKAADIAAETRKFLAECIAPVDTYDWRVVRTQIGDFCREGAYICTVKKAAEMISTGQIPEGGFARMFEDAQAVGQAVDLSEVQNGLALYEVTPPDTTVLGNRWGERGEVVMLVGASGIGKSSGSMQMDACWAVGREAFGIKSSHALKIVCIQAEDSLGDLHEMMTGTVDGLKFTEDEKAMLARNLHYVRHNRTNGEAFLVKIVAQYLAEFKPDLLRLNPLHAYLGGDPSDPKVVSPWLRLQLTTLMQRYECLGMINHHTSKTVNRDTRNWRTLDWSYALAGSAELTNAPRAILAIDATAVPHVFRFIAAKRGNRIGWRDKDGKPEAIRYFSQSREEGKILWTPATAADMQEVEQAAQAQKEARRRGPLYTDNVLLKPLLEKGAVLSLPQLFKRVQDSGCPICESQFFARAQKYIAEGILVAVGKDTYELNVAEFSRLNATPVKQTRVTTPRPAKDY